jgi:hypothetical protein
MADDNPVVADNDILPNAAALAKLGQSSVESARKDFNVHENLESAYRETRGLDAKRVWEESVKGRYGTEEGEGGESVNLLNLCPSEYFSTEDFDKRFYYVYAEEFVCLSQQLTNAQAEILVKEGGPDAILRACFKWIKFNPDWETVKWVG